MRPAWAAGGLALLAVLGPAPPAGAATCAPAGTSIANDFDGNGHADALVRRPWDTATPGVHVLYGAQGGVFPLQPSTTAPDDQLFSPGRDGVPGGWADDGFGQAMATGDFDGDGCTDAAIGTDRPNPGAGPPGDIGGVLVLYGSPAAGLTTAGHQLIGQDTPGVPGDPEADDAFGTALAAGDFDADGYADLAVGALGEEVVSRAGSGPVTDHGAVIVLYGSPSGLGGGPAATVLHQDVAGVPGAAEPHDIFGATLAAGDFDGNGRDDLAVGAPGENDGSGTVLVFPSAGASGSRMFGQDTRGIPGTAETGDRFGRELAAGDVTGDGRADLAVGVPGEDDWCGAVIMLYGSAASVGGAGSAAAQLFSQSTTGVAGLAAAEDMFASSLAIGRLDGDKQADLAIGVPRDQVGTGGPAAGSVTVLYGRPTGLTASGSRRLHQDVAGIAGAAEGGDEFGYAVAALPLAGASVASLLVGVPGEDLASTADQDAGLLHVLAPGPGGPAAPGQTLTEDSPGMAGDPEIHGRFGQVVR